MAQHETNAASTHPPEAKARKGGLFGKLNVLLFLVSVVGAECLAAYFFIPSASEVAAASSGKGGAESEKDPHGKEAAKDDHGHGKGAHVDPFAEEKNAAQENLMEIDLKQFTLTCTRPASNTTWRVEFHLYGVIKKDQEAEFKALVDHHQNRIRDQVGFIIRSGDLSELTDPGLGLIKRKILTKVNETLGKPLLHGVVFSEFTFTEH